MKGLLASAFLFLFASLPGDAASFSVYCSTCGSLSLTNWTQIYGGGGGNMAHLSISAQGVRIDSGDVFSAWIWSTTDNSWHNLATTASMPAANWLYYPANTSANQTYQGFPNYPGTIDQQGCPSSATCAYMYGGNYVYYSNNISTTSPGSITWCNTGGFTKQNDNPNTVVGQNNPGQYIAVDPYNASHVIVATQQSGLFESFNADSAWNSGACTGTAATWASIPTGAGGIPAATGAPVPYNIAFDSTGGTTTRSGHTVAAKLYIYSAGSTAGVRASTDGGATYTLTTSGPSTVKHIKVSGASAGGGNVWVVDGSTNLWVYASGVWTQVSGVSGVYDVTINVNNGNHIVALHGGSPSDLYVCASNCTSGSAAFTEQTATLAAGDTGWLSWAAIGTNPGNVEFDSSINDVILANMGQGVWQTTYPSGSFVWSALSKGIEGAQYSHLVVPSQETIAIGAQDTSGCQYKITTANTPPSTCFPTAAYLALAYASSLSMTPDRTLTYAKIGADGGAGVGADGYSTDGFKSNYLPLNLWNATVAASGTTMADNGSGKLRVQVASTTLLNTWAAGDAITRNSIMCVFSSNNVDVNTTYLGFIQFNNTCDEIVVHDSTHFDMPNIDYSSGLSTNGFSFIFYVPGYAQDENFGLNAVVNVTSATGLVQITGDTFQIGQGSPFCVSGVTMSGATVVNGCWVNAKPQPNYNLPVILAGSTFAGADTYTTGGVLTTYGNAGGDIAPASSTNVSEVSVNSFPLCTTNGGQSWAYERVTGDAGAAGTFASGLISAGATTATIATGSWPFPGANQTVKLTSGRWLSIYGSQSGSTLTFTPAVPPGDSIPSGATFYGNTGYNAAYYNSQVALVRDWVTPNTFYAVNANVGLIKWTNCGTPTIVIAETAQTGWLSQYGGYGKAATVPGEAGHLFWTVGLTFGGTYPANTSLYRTCGLTGSSATMQRVPGFYNAKTVGFGAAAGGQSYPTEYVVGWYDSTGADNQNIAVFGIWESTNDPNNGATGTCNVSSQTWANIGTATQNAAGGTPLGWGYNSPGDIEGDPFVHGPVYYSGQFGLSYTIQNYLLKRDLNPASNDNTPAGLNKAA